MTEGEEWLLLISEIRSSNPVIGKCQVLFTVNSIVKMNTILKSQIKLTFFDNFKKSTN